MRPSTLSRKSQWGLVENAVEALLALGQGLLSGVAFCDVQVSDHCSTCTRRYRRDEHEEPACVAVVVGVVF